MTQIVKFVQKKIISGLHGKEVCLALGSSVLLYYTRGREIGHS